MPRRRSSSTIGWCTAAAISRARSASIPGTGRVAPHPARVRALVAVEDALVVLRRRERHRTLAVAEREQRELLALEELLQDHLGLAEALLTEEHVDGVAGLALVLGDDHALAGREHVGLQHGGIRGAGEVRRRLLAVAEHHVRGGGHAAVAHQLLGVCLRALDARRRAGRPEGGDAGGAQGVNEACHERRLGAHDDEIDLTLPGRLDHVATRQALHSVPGDPGVARRGQHLERAAPAEERADDRVLAAARAHDQDASIAQSAEMKSSTGIADRVS